MATVKKEDENKQKRNAVKDNVNEKRGSTYQRGGSYKRKYGSEDCILATICVTIVKKILLKSHGPFILATTKK